MSIIIHGHHLYVSYPEIVVGLYIDCVVGLCALYWHGRRKARWSKGWDKRI